MNTKKCLPPGIGEREKSNESAMIIPFTRVTKKPLFPDFPPSPSKQARMVVGERYIARMREIITHANEATV